MASEAISVRGAIHPRVYGPQGRSCTRRRRVPSLGGGGWFWVKVLADGMAEKEGTVDDGCGWWLLVVVSLILVGLFCVVCVLGRVAWWV